MRPDPDRQALLKRALTAEHDLRNVRKLLAEAEAARVAARKRADRLAAGEADPELRALRELALRKFHAYVHMPEATFGDVLQWVDAMIEQALHPRGWHAG